MSPVDLGASLPPGPSESSPGPIEVSTSPAAAPPPDKDELRAAVADTLRAAVADMAAMRRELVKAWEVELEPLAEEAVRVARAAAAGDGIAERDLLHIKAQAAMAASRVILGESTRLARTLETAAVTALRIVTRAITKGLIG